MKSFLRWFTPSGWRRTKEDLILEVLLFTWWLAILFNFAGVFNMIFFKDHYVNLFEMQLLEHYNWKRDIRNVLHFWFIVACSFTLHFFFYNCFILNCWFLVTHFGLQNVRNGLFHFDFYCSSWFYFFIGISKKKKEAAFNWA